jgi:putative transposase
MASRNPTRVITYLLITTSSIFLETFILSVRWEGMTLPKQILPNTTYLVTRRCTQRFFLLKPSPLNTQIFTYCLAMAAKKTGMLVHAIAVLSNHYHVVLTDPYARLPEFSAYLHKLVAKCVNASLGRWENLWSSEKPSAVKLSSADDVMKRVVYTACNPVAAGLVAKPQHWPGLIAYLPGQKLTAKRPAVYFSEDGKMEESAELTLTMPPQYGHLNEQEYVAQLTEKIGRKEESIHAEMNQTGRFFMGRQAVMQQRHTDSPLSREPRRNLNPQVACKSKWHRIEALQRLKSFQSDYKEALKRWRDGEHNVVFPAGTYAMRVHAGVKCAPTQGAPP